MSSASSPCRIEWRVSRWAVSGAVLIGALAALALVLSDLPASWRLWLAVLVFALGLHGAWREARRRPWTLIWEGADANAQRLTDGRVEAVSIVSIHRRGPLAGITLNDANGRTVHALWWPDTLSAASRRELALRAGALDAEPPPPHA